MNFESKVALSPAFRLEADIDVPIAVGETPTGNRTFIEVTSSRLTGSGLEGEGVGASGDWVVLGADGYGKLDVRMHVKDKASGEILYVSYTGHLEGKPEVMAAVGKAPDAKSQPFDSYRHHVTLTFETAGKKFAWTNRTVFVGKGSFEHDSSSKRTTVVYEIYKLE